MSFRILFVDEFRGFAKSRIMIVLWIGLPLLTLTLRLLVPAAEGLSQLQLVSVVIASVGGTLAAVMLGTTLTSERNRSVYDLFLIRPVSRRDLLLAKFAANLSSLFAAVVLSVALGTIVDLIAGNLSGGVARGIVESLVLSVTGIATACSVGLLFGTIFDSVAVTAILSVYLGNQLSSIVLLPGIFLDRVDPLLFSAVAGVATCVVVLVAAIYIFERKSL